ncbi:MAG: hypothetical protein MJZ68_02865 [archaeon]|nr:hypothetical protein [archaeon]
MSSISNMSFGTSSSVSHFQFTVDAGKKRIGVECLGMGLAWDVPDHKWDYPLDPACLGPIAEALEECKASGWGKTGEPDGSDGRFWNLEVTYTDGSEISAEGFGEFPEGFPVLMRAMKAVTSMLTKEIFLDGPVPDAYYFSYTPDGMDIVSYTVFADGDVSVEHTSGGVPVTVHKTLPQGGMEIVQNLVRRSGIPFMGLSHSNTDNSFASQAAYIGGRMVSNTCSGRVTGEWVGLYGQLKSYIDVLDEKEKR